VQPLIKNFFDELELDDINEAKEEKQRQEERLKKLP
jgi:uncharacterized protein (DUF433 family)